MAVEFTIRCDGRGKPGPKTTTDGAAPRNTIEALRVADGGFKRFRPFVTEGMKELCSKCEKKHHERKARAEKAKAKDKAHSKAGPTPKAKAKVK